MKKEVELGKVKHKCELMGDGDLQVDTFITKIPLECLSDEGIGLLNYWCVGVVPCKCSRKIPKNLLN